MTLSDDEIVAGVRVVREALGAEQGYSGTTPLTVDAVALQRQIREQVSRETAGMSFEELQRYLRSHITVPFAATPPHPAAA